jgi:hypothetical protein
VSHKAQAVPPLDERRKPGLGETLPGERHPEVCQSCGKRDSVWTRWMECDPWDQPTETIVILCRTCEKRLIQPHARLYRALDSAEVRPGAMVLCAACDHRRELRCGHPDLRANGGKGLGISQPKQIGIACGDGGCRPVYNGIPNKCVGRMVEGTLRPDLYAVPEGGSP